MATLPGILLTLLKSFKKCTTLPDQAGQLGQHNRQKLSERETFHLKKNIIIVRINHYSREDKQNPPNRYFSKVIFSDFCKNAVGDDILTKIGFC